MIARALFLSFFSYLETLNQLRGCKKVRGFNKHLVGSLFFLLGEKGESTGEEAARATAEVLSQRLQATRGVS